MHVPESVTKREKSLSWNNYQKRKENRIMGKKDIRHLKNLSVYLKLIFEFLLCLLNLLHVAGELVLDLLQLGGPLLLGNRQLAAKNL